MSSPTDLTSPTRRHLADRRLLRRLAARAVSEQVRHRRGLALPLQADLALPGLPGSLDGTQDVGNGTLFGGGGRGIRKSSTALLAQALSAGRTFHFSGQVRPYFTP